MNLELVKQEIIPEFPMPGTLVNVIPYGSGHINDTFTPIFLLDDGSQKRYILQRINTSIFTNADRLMDNILGVTEYLKQRIEQAGGDPERETLTVLRTKSGKPLYRDSLGGCWRCYLFVEGSVSYDLVEKPEDFYTVAKAFGNFQMLLANYPADTLYESIPDFHNTWQRFQNLRHAVEEDRFDRAKDVQAEIDFAFSREADTRILVDMLKKGELPLRVTHNDTKLNNILIDAKTGNGLCVIDLDTVMPGLAHYDYGDSIRFGASTALEDELDLSKVEMDLSLFEIFTKGFLETAGEVFTVKEKQMLPMGAKLMTLECGMRFLTDYLQGDTYFKIHRPKQNVDRCRTQFKLVADMEEKWERMEKIVKHYS